MSKLNVVEAFSGIGSQAKALKKANIPYDIVATIEWEIGAIYAYDIIHNGPQKESDLVEFYQLNKRSLIEKLAKYNLSSDGKKPISYRGLQYMNEDQLRAILCSIKRTKNKVDIMNVHPSDLPEQVDLFTYSFPCQDLSISGFWHGNISGIDRHANNRSSLLWQVERILKEYVEDDRILPKFLLMENVTAIDSPMHRDNFLIWQNFLKGLNYENYIFTLDARNFGIPQRRIRTYMLSVQCGSVENKEKIESYISKVALNKKSRIETPNLNRILKLDYTNRKYFAEAVASIPNKTPSRDKILANGHILAKGSIVEPVVAKTVTTKQDRNPNAGLIVHEIKNLIGNKAPYRNLTPRETFLLMGFEEKDFDLLLDNNIKLANRLFLSKSKLLKLAGNSIVVDVLVDIFKMVEHINDVFLFDKSVDKLKSIG
ncbi:DNA (cytosine-5-)-methyltransferase [Carnobacterium sp.]|uniref:DNA (cytosine-5-)-methyltransferase n=1 Tax=Carnobacterium sp. TaxID=48221 RepID=UPI002FC78D4C